MCPDCGFLIREYSDNTLLSDLNHVCEVTLSENRREWIEDNKWQHPSPPPLTFHYGNVGLTAGLTFMNLPASYQKPDEEKVVKLRLPDGRYASCSNDGSSRLLIGDGREVLVILQRSISGPSDSGLKSRIISRINDLKTKEGSFLEKLISEEIKNNDSWSRKINSLRRQLGYMPPFKPIFPKAKSTAIALGLPGNREWSEWLYKYLVMGNKIEPPSPSIQVSSFVIASKNQPSVTSELLHNFIASTPLTNHDFQREALKAMESHEKFWERVQHDVTDGVSQTIKGKSTGRKPQNPGRIDWLNRLGRPKQITEEQIETRLDHEIAEAIDRCGEELCLNRASLESELRGWLGKHKVTVPPKN